MCFSATASFAASAALGVIGIATVAQVKNRRELPLAIVPLIFAFQQLLEGLIWLSLHDSGNYNLPLTYIYLFFAFFFWPIYAPIVVYLMEKDNLRKKIISIFFLGGVVVGIWLYSLFIASPTPAEIINKCVYYRSQIGDVILPSILYFFATIGVIMASSRRLVNIFGVFAFASALVAWWFYYKNFTSVWCFFAAVLSLLIYFYFRFGRKPPKGSKLPG